MRFIRRFGTYFPYSRNRVVILDWLGIKLNYSQFYSETEFNTNSEIISINDIIAKNQINANSEIISINDIIAKNQINANSEIISINDIINIGKHTPIYENVNYEIELNFIQV
ncbi:MAG: hypothetical protein WC319_08660 [Candidatus Paceibacterota bacterium]|jgi:predicted DNA-binding protein with PD1-like motif